MKGSTRGNMWEEYSKLSIQDKRKKILSIIETLTPKGLSCEKTVEYIKNNENLSEEYLDKVYTLIMEPITKDYDNELEADEQKIQERNKKLEDLYEIQKQKDEKDAENILNSVLNL